MTDLKILESNLVKFRDLMDRPDLNEQQFRQLCEYGSVSVQNLPPAPHEVDGEPRWRTSAIQQWLINDSIRIRSSAANCFRKSTDMPEPMAGQSLTVRAGSGQMHCKSWNELTRTGEAVFASETPATVVGYQNLRYVSEILVADGGEFPTRFPVLDSHQRSSTTTVIGSATNCRQQGGQWIGFITLADDEHSQAIGRKIRDGHLDSVSIGYSVLEYHDIPPGHSKTIRGREYRNTGELTLRVTTRWRVHEVSVVPIGADPTAKIRSNIEGIPNMPSFSTPAIHSRNTISDRPSVRALLCGGVQRAGLDPSQPLAVLGPSGIERITPSAQDIEMGERYVTLPFYDRVIIAAEADGIRVNGRSIRDDLWQIHNEIRKKHERGYSANNLDLLCTGSFLSLLVSKIDRSRSSIRGIVGEADRPNFKVNPNVRLSGVTLKRHHKGGQAHHVGFALSSEDSQVVTYSGQFQVGEEDHINNMVDDIYETESTQMANAVVSLELDLIYATLAANPVLSDGTELFHADHGNLKTGAALADATLGAAMAAMASQEENGVKLNLRAGYLLVPTKLERTAQKLARDVYGGDRESTPPPIVRSDSRLDNGGIDPVTDGSYAGSATTWYVAAGNGQHGLQLQYLKGRKRLPRVLSSFLDRGEFGMNISVDHCVGVAVTGHRGLVKCEG